MLNVYVANINVGAVNIYVLYSNPAYNCCVSIVLHAAESTLDGQYREINVAKTPAYHHGNLRQALIEAGAHLVEEKGVADISLREVAKAASVSHTAPYRHFKDKNALLTAIAETGFQHLERAIHQAVEQNPDNHRAQLIGSGVAYIRLALEHREMFHLMFGGLLQAEQASDALQLASEASFQNLVMIIHAGQQAGIYKPSDSYELALTAWSLIHGFAMLASTGKLNPVADSADAMLNLAGVVESYLIDGIAR